jgi:DNA-binding SARP family transcriptional activator
MGQLSISLLGTFQITLDGKQIDSFESNKVRGLLAYLAIEGDQPQSREKLGDLLWPDCSEKTARSNLRNVISKLRKAIQDQEASPRYLCVSRQSLQLNPDGDVVIDAREFSDLIENRESPQDEISRLEEAMGLYRGGFLDGFSIGDSRIFDEWVSIKREQYHRLALSALHRLSKHYEHLGDYEGALPYTWQEVELEPWREQAHRHLMRLLAQNGQRGAALAQYETCRQILRQEFDVEPALETIQLYEQIREGQFSPQKQPAAQQVVGERIKTEQIDARGESASASHSLRSKWSKSPKSIRLLVGGLALILLIGLSWLLVNGRNLTGKNVLGSNPEIPLPSPNESRGLIIDGCSHPPKQLCLIDKNTGEVTPVTSENEFSNIDPIGSWSPDGKQIVFGASEMLDPVEIVDFNLYIVTLSNLEIQPVTGGPGNDNLPVWSPDGEWIAYHRDCQLWIVRPDGSETKMLRDSSKETCYMGMAWSPDSQQIAFLNLGNSQDSSIQSEVAIINRDGSNYRKISTPEKELASGALAWSPDGQYISCLCSYVNSEHETFLLIDTEKPGAPQTIDSVPISWFHYYWDGVDNNR